MRLTDQTVIVTGGGSGIGRAIAVQLAEAGCRVTIAGRRLEALQETARLAPNADHPMHVESCDLARTGAPQELFEAADAHWGRVDAIVNNAALGDLRPLLETDDALVQATFDLNFRAPLKLINAAMKSMMKQGAGRIINISSMAVVSPFPGLGIYGASKCALDSVTRSIMNEHGDDGIRAWSIAPGAVETSLLRSLFDESVIGQDMTMDPEVVANVATDCLLGRREQDAGTVIEVVPAAS